MPPKEPHQPNRSPQPNRPLQDVVTKNNQAQQFPGIGMTLSSYQQANQTPAGSLDAARAALPKKRRFTLKRVMLSLLVLVLIIGGILGGKLAYDLHKVFGGNIFSFLFPTKLKGESSGHVNILLAGNSSDDPGHSGADLTDSIMLISLNTKNHTGWLLSIPRDLWVNIGYSGYVQKINAAYDYGNTNGFSASGYPNGGMGQLEQVVSRDFNIPIDYYALINYTAIRDAVNTVGGININISSTDPRGLYDPSIDYATHGPLVDLTNGQHHLNGEQALDLARARGDAYGSYGFANSDFARTQNQREMLVALKDKVVSAGTLANPLRIASLLDTLGGNVKTDFTPSQVRRLYDLVNKTPSAQVKSLSLNSANGKDLLASYYSYASGDALIPAAGFNNYSAIQAFINSQN